MPPETTSDPSPGKRLPRLHRADPSQRPRFRLQAPDIALLKWIFDCRFLTSRHLTALDHRSMPYVLDRLQGLFHHAYVDRIPVSHNNIFIYAMANRGADVIAEHYGLDRGKIDWHKKNRELKDEYFRAHTLMVGDFRANLALWLPTVPGVTLAPVSPPQELWYVDEGGKRRKVEPDWPFILYVGDEDALDFFHESDRSNETHAIFFQKLRGYWLFYKQEVARAKAGQEAFDAFRVLTVCKTEVRAQNLRALAKEVDDHQTGSGLFWFTSQERYNIEQPSQLGAPIWQTPKNDGFHHLLE